MDVWNQINTWEIYKYDYKYDEMNDYVWTKRCDASDMLLM